MFKFLFSAATLIVFSQTVLAGGYTITFSGSYTPRDPFTVGRYFKGKPMLLNFAKKSNGSYCQIGLAVCRFNGNTITLDNQEAQKAIPEVAFELNALPLQSVEVMNFVNSEMPTTFVMVRAQVRGPYSTTVGGISTDTWNIKAEILSAP